MSYIHPRDKRPLGQRLANAALAVAYGDKQAHTQPTLSGCSVSTDGRSIVVSFDAQRLGGDTVLVQKYSAAQEGASAMEVLDTATGNWSFVDVQAASASSVKVLLKAGISAVSIRYAWGDNPCCGSNNRTVTPCPPASCPLLTKRTSEPAVPFQAAIKDGTCVLVIV